MKTSSNFLAINVPIYRLHVLITWGTTPEQIRKYSAKHKLELAESFEREFKGHLADGALGLCMEPKANNADILVWMKERPLRASSYGTLYHELYHAVDSISESRSLADEPEARAYVFEYLVTEANRFFWSKQK